MPTDSELQAMQQMVTAALQASTRELTKLVEKSKEATGASGGFTAMNTALTSMSRSLLGPVGVAAGFYALSKSLESVATSAVSLSNFARDTGFATKSVSDIQGALRMMGQSTEQANKSIAGLGEKLQNLAVFRESSEIWQGMAKFPGKGAEIANTLMKIAQDGMKTGDQMGALAKMLELFNKQAPETKFAWAQVWGESVSNLEQMARKLAVVRKLALPQWSKEEEEQYLEDLVAFELRAEYVWKRIASHAIGAANEIGDKFEEVFGGEGGAVNTVIEFFKNEIDKTASTIKNTFDEIKWLMSGGPERFLRSQQLALKPYPAGGDPMAGHDYRYPMGEDPVSADRDRRRDEIENDQAKTLNEIRDILERMDVRQEGGGGGAGGAEDTTGRGKLGARLGMRSPGGGGEGPGGQGRVAGGNVDMVGGEKSPTGLYYPGTSQKLMGVVGSDSASRGRGQHQGDDFSMKYGSPLYATKSGVVESYGVDNFGQKTMRIRHDDGSSTSYLHMSERTAPVGSKVEGGQIIGASGTANQVPHLHIEMRDPKGQLIEPSVALGIRGKPGSVRGSYFNDRKTASGVDASKVAGIALPTREGLGKMHEITLEDGRKITLPQIDVGPAGWTGRGVDFSTPSLGMLGMDPTDRNFSVRRIDNEADRARIDASQSSAGAFGRINAAVEFLNVPNGVKTSADTEGDVFKQLQISRTKQNGVYNNPNPGYE